MLRTASRTNSVAASRVLGEQRRTLKVVAALYADPVKGYPKPQDYARTPGPNALPKLPSTYVDGQRLPTPSGVDFLPGTLLGSKSGELGLRKFLESRGHEFVVVVDKDGPGSDMEKEVLGTGKSGSATRAADIIISQPFWPYYVTPEIVAHPNFKAKMCLTAGIGSDHYAVEALTKKNVTIAEVTFCNSISVSEHVVMMILALVRNYIPSYKQTITGGWNIADCVSKSYDVEGLHIGTVAAGRIGLAVLRRLKPFDVKLSYYDKHRLPASVEKELNLTYYSDYKQMFKDCDVVTLNCPLHPETEHMVNDKLLSESKRGLYIVNTARGKLCDRDAITRALKSGQLAGYAGDVWFPQPPPKDHPWRDENLAFAMTPHISGTSLSAQARYAAGVREILECFLDGKPIRNEYLISQGGKLAGVGAHSYTMGNSTSGSEEAAKDKKKKA